MFGLTSGPMLNMMLKALTKYMRSEGVTAIVLRRNDLVTDGDTPGVEVQSYNIPVGVVSGQEDNDFARKAFELRERFNCLTPAERMAHGMEGEAAELVADAIKLFLPVEAAQAEREVADGL